MRPQDLYKLAYQSEFGCGHMIADEAESLRRIRAELSTAQATAQPPEPIGGGYCRIHLGALGALGISAQTLNRMFFLSANAGGGTAEGLLQKLALARAAFADAAAARGDAESTVRRFDDHVEKMRLANFPAAGHSDEYRAAYRPAYRVVRADLCRFIPVFALADSLLCGRADAYTIAVDGNCCSGKSSLADLLRQIYDCNVFHMDDYFLRPSQRTPDRLRTPGGNVDHERFACEIGENLRSGRPFRYCRFDCGAQRLEPPTQVEPARLSVVEGSYSMHPRLRRFYDASVFLKIDEKTQLARLRRRESADMLERFVREWIPLERLYFDACSVENACDLLLDTSSV